jgi:chaperonin GroES
MSTLIPNRSRIVVKKIEADAKSKTGLIISSDEDKRTLKGQVYYIGEDAVNIDGKILPMMVKINDIVFFSPFTSHPIKVNGEEFIVIDEKEVLAILRD